MKLREINERPEWTFWVPDSIADWDAPSHWERSRLASMEKWLRRGDVLFDIGTEHGWLSAVYGSFVGYENMVLVEPSPEFWPNIRLTWERNHFPHPLATVQAFASATSSGQAAVHLTDWPASAVGAEIGAMAYRYLFDDTETPSITVDDLARVTAAPKALTVDVEGAEILVMQGAASTLLHDRPHVWISVHPDLMKRDFDEHPDTLFSLMTQVGYSGRLLGIDHEEHWYFRPLEWGW